MAFLGNQPAAQFTTIPTVQRFNGTGSATEFTLDRAVTSVQSIMVSVDGVIQDTSSYTIPDGVTLTFSSAPSSGTGNIFINYLGLVLGTVTHPSTSSLSATNGTFSGEVDAASLDISGNIDVDGTTNLDVVDIDGALTQDGGAVFNEAAASVDFRVESDTDAHALIVDGSANRVGIGVAAPASKLEISAGVNSHGLLRLDDTDAGNLGGYMQFDSNGTNKANIQNANNAGIHLCVGTGGSVTFTALGYTAANALDDYEEGTWTPTFQSGGASFGYSSQGGTYTKVGRLILASFRLALSGSPSGTTSNSVVVGGLPFTTGTLNQTYHGGAFGHYFAFNLSQTGVLVYQLASGSGTVELKVVGDNLGETAVVASNLNSNAEIRGQIVYHTV